MCGLELGLQFVAQKKEVLKFHFIDDSLAETRSQLHERLFPFSIMSFNWIHSESWDWLRDELNCIGGGVRKIKCEVKINRVENKNCILID